jgi:N-acetylglucosamine kinase-like BadF-type ATPase
VGVDAGGTKTRAAFARGSEIQRTAEGPSGSVTVRGIADATDAILQAVRAASAGEPFAALYVGAAGVGSPAVGAEITSLVQAAYPRAAVHVGDDVEIALRGAIPSGAGIVLVAGTGSIAMAADEASTLHRAGGAGYLLGDEGSAAWIGLEAVRRLSRVYDGRDYEEETSRLVARHLAAPDWPALIRAIYGERVDVARIAALAPSIIAFAGKGNRVSRAIVERAAEELIALLTSVARAANLLDAVAPVALSGGLLAEENLLRTLLEREIAAALPSAQLVQNADPLLGAVRCALALLA